MSRTSQIQQLYVGLLGRAADAEGLQYWNDTGLSIAEIANWIVESAEEFPRTDRDDAVVALYANLFNREPDAEGRNYWVNESEVSIDELVLHLIEWADQRDSTALENRTFVANAYTNNAGDELDLEAAAAVIADVNHTPQSVASALETIEGGSFDPTEALVAYQETASDLRDVLEGAASNKAFAGFFDGTTDPLGTNPATGAPVTDDSSNEEIEAVVDYIADVLAAGVSGQLTALGGALGADGAKFTSYAGSFADASSSVQAGIISEAQAAAAEYVKEAQADLASEHSGQVARVNNLVNAATALERAADSAAAAATAALAEFAKFEVLNPTANYAPSTGKDDVVLTVGGVDVLVVNSAGNRVQLTDDGRALELPGIDALLPLAQADFQAALARENAANLLESRMAAVDTVENDLDPAATAGDYDEGVEYSLTINLATGKHEIDMSAFTATVPDSEALIDARGVEAALADAISNFQGILQLTGAIEALNDAVDAAAEALEATGYDVADVTPGVGGLADTAFGGEGDDLFVYTEEALVVYEFGLEGDDLLFIGGDYEVFMVEAGQDVGGSDRLGDASTLELFFQQEGNNAAIYVEKVAHAGNQVVTNDLVKIELQGVNVADLAYENGFILAA